MKETLTADKTAIIETYQKSNATERALIEKLFGKELFKTDWRKDLYAACAALGIDKKTVLPYAKPINKEEEVLNAYAALRVLAKWKRGDWEPDWNDGNAKYYPWFDMRSGSGFAFGVCVYADSGSYVGGRLCFPTRDMAEDFGKQYLPLYEIVFTN